VSTPYRNGTGSMGIKDTPLSPLLKEGTGVCIPATQSLDSINNTFAEVSLKESVQLSLWVTVVNEEYSVGACSSAERGSKLPRYISMLGGAGCRIKNGHSAKQSAHVMTK